MNSVLTVSFELDDDRIKKKSLGILLRLSFYLSELMIPSSATLNGNKVFGIYKPMWVEILTEEQTSFSRLKNVLKMLLSSLEVFKNHYLYGDFEGACLRQRILKMIKLGT